MAKKTSKSKELPKKVTASSAKQVKGGVAKKREHKW